MKKLFLLLIITTSLYSQSGMYKGKDGKIYTHDSHSDSTGQGYDTEIPTLDTNKIFYERFYTCGTATFSGTARRLAIYVKGATTASLFSVEIITANDVVPVAGDLVSLNRKTDSLIILRPASGTSGLTVSWGLRKK